MRSREQRWAARSARGWPRVRVSALVNGVAGILLGALLFYLTHGLLRFQNFPALDVHWAWRVLALIFAVLLPGVLLARGAYLVLAGATASNRRALHAGQSRAVALDTPDPDGAATVIHELPPSAPPGIKIRAHALHHANAPSRYTRDLVGALAVQSLAALAPLGAGILLLVIATVYYSTGYGEAALVILLGVAYLAWKLWRGYRSHRVFTERHGSDAPNVAAPSAPATRATPVVAPGDHFEDHEHDDGVTARSARATESARDTEEYREVSEDTDELPVIERIRDNYSEPKKASAAERRLAERAERERLLSERREQRQTRAEETVRAASEEDARRERAERDRVAAEERLRIYAAGADTPRNSRQARSPGARGAQQEEAASLLGYAMTRWRRRGERD